MDKAKALMKAKEDVEAELLAMHDELQQMGLGLRDSLKDDQDFPRNDVDVYRARHLRSQISARNNDLRKLMVDIEAALHEVHATKRDEQSKDDSSADDAATAAAAAAAAEHPFLWVAAVTAGRPAANSGLQAGDGILQFGSVKSSNYTGMAAVAAVMRHSNGADVDLLVLRGAARLSLRIKNDGGSLGCQLVEKPI